MSTQTVSKPGNKAFLSIFTNLSLVEKIAWALFVAYWLPAFSYFFKAWGNPDGYYSHGYLIPFMCGWTAFLKRDQIKNMPYEPSKSAFIPLLIFLAFSTLAGFQNSQTIRGLMFPATLAWFVAALYGWNYLKQYVFSVFYLYFLCPIPEFMLTRIAFSVQIWSTIIATFMSKAFLVNAFRTGTSISTPNGGILDVGAPCSGFRMLVALTAFAVFLVYSLKGDLWRKIVFVVIAMPMSVLLNSLRVAILVAVSEYINPDPDMFKKLHDMSGYLVLIIAFYLMYLIIARLLGCREFRLMESSSS